MPEDTVPAKHPLGQPVSAIDGSDLIQLAGAAYAWLKQHTQIVNALNVFPVPDGDTGTNMVLTMHAACKA
ncbi:MAG: DAK2 domain-containing protein, partial [Caldilineales bacterium]|nr:DAK2 domain-containing protein [Caldilineales bacterium]